MYFRPNDIFDTFAVSTLDLACRWFFGLCVASLSHSANERETELSVNTTCWNSHGNLIVINLHQMKLVGKSELKTPWNFPPENSQILALGKHKINNRIICWNHPNLIIVALSIVVMGVRRSARRWKKFVYSQRWDQQRSVESLKKCGWEKTKTLLFNDTKISYRLFELIFPCFFFFCLLWLFVSFLLLSVCCISRHSVNTFSNSFSCFFF